jgi:hypothetical protein
MTIQDKIEEKGFETALKDDVKALQCKAGLGPGWSPYPWDALSDYVIELEKRVKALEEK